MGVSMVPRFLQRLYENFLWWKYKATGKQIRRTRLLRDSAENKEIRGSYQEELERIRKNREKIGRKLGLA